MRLRSLSLYQFGRHNGQVLSDLHDGLTVVVGPNEAGKSTLLAGIRGMLFGKLGTAEGNVDLAVGAHGRAQVEDDHGVSYVIERALHRKSPPKISFEDGRVLSGDDLLKTILPELGMVEATIYSAIFSFQLAELKGFQDTDKSLQSRIYTVGMFGSLSPFELEEAFRNSAREIYNRDKRARNASLIQCLQTIDQLREQMKAQDMTPAAFLATKRAREAVFTGRVAVEQELREIRERKEEIRKDRTVFPTHRTIVELSERLRLLDSIPRVTEDQVRSVEDWKSEATRLSDAVQSKRKEKEELLRSIEAVEVDLQLVQLLPQLHELKAVSSGVAEQLRQIEEKAQDIADLEQSSQQLRESLSDKWTDQHIASADLSLAVLNQVAETEAKFAALQGDIEALKRHLIHQDSDVNQKRTVLTSATNGLSEPAELRSQWEAVEQKYNRLLEDEERLDDIQAMVDRLTGLDADIEALETSLNSVRDEPSGSRAPIHWLWIGLAALFLLGVAGSTKVPWFGITVGAISILFAVMLSVFVRQRQSANHSGKFLELQSQLDHRRVLQSKCLESIRELTAGLCVLRTSVDSIRAVPNVQQAKRDLRALKQEVERDRMRCEHALRCLESLQLAQDERTRIQNQLASLEQANERELDSWQREMVARGLPAKNTTPAGFLSEAKVVRELRSQLVAGDQKRLARSQMCDQVQEHLERVELCLAMVAANPEDEVATTQEATSDFPSLYRVFQRRLVHLEQALERGQANVDLLQERERTGHELDFVVQQLQAQVDRVAALSGQVQSLYESLGIETDEDFRRVIENKRERDEIERQLREACIEAYTVFGGRESYESRRTSLNHCSVVSLEEQLQHATAAETELQGKLELLSKELWEIEARLSAWQDGVPALDLAFKYEQAQAEKRELARQWAGLTIAQVLARQAREQYEHTRQPETLRSASEVFCAITVGRYKGIKASVSGDGKPALYCIDDRDVLWPLERLSRGTREQVYLALRIALIRDYAGRGIALPVVLDDPMVNFDDRRMESYFRCLAAEANQQQLLYLTCHPEIVAFARQHGNVQILTLDP